MVLALLAVFSALLIAANGMILPRKEKVIPPQCQILNHETVPDETVPEEIVVNGIRYQVLQQIQHGATSRVFHTVEQVPPPYDEVRCRAVKVVDMERIEQEKQNQLNNEAQILHELTAARVHAIPKMYTIEHNPAKSMSIVFELAHHDLFDEITDKMGRDEHLWVRGTLHDIVRAIQPVHASGIVHGDIKPENMAYFHPNSSNFAPDQPANNADLVLKLIDFGGAMRTHKMANACEEIVTGTIMYMSPEQVAWCAAHGEDEYIEKRKEHQMSPKSDVWSVGVILYQMMYGHPPYNSLLKVFEQADGSEERTELADAELRPAILHGTEPIQFADYEDAQLLEILKKCLQRHPEHRPSTEELLAHLEKLNGQQDLKQEIFVIEAPQQKQAEEEQEAPPPQQQFYGPEGIQILLNNLQKY